MTLEEKEECQEIYTIKHNSKEAENKKRNGERWRNTRMKRKPERNTIRKCHEKNNTREEKKMKRRAQQRETKRVHSDLLQALTQSAFPRKKKTKRKEMRSKERDEKSQTCCMHSYKARSHERR